MGILRLYLAIAVVNEHFGFVNPRLFISADLAVECFFVISGFYMTMMIKKHYGSKLRFYYANRFLRVWPVYFTVLFGSVSLFLLVTVSAGNLPTNALPNAFDYWHFFGKTLDPVAMALLITSHLTIMGQEWVSAFEFDRMGNVYAVGFKALTQFSLAKFMFLPQGWSLGIEEFFYLISPKYVKLSNVSLVLLFLVSIAFMPISSTFPPACLAMFGGGC